MMSPSVRSNIFKVCASEDSDVDKCPTCQRVGDIVIGGWNTWDCGKAEGSMIYISNNAEDPDGKLIHYIIGCEVYASGYPV